MDITKYIPEKNYEKFVSETGQYHYLYIIINNINEHFYIGIHSTHNIYDGYMGSGRDLKIAYKQFKRSNFSKHILKFFNNREELLKAEKDLLTDEFLIKYKQVCYNKAEGGQTGSKGLCTIVTNSGTKTIRLSEYKANKSAYESKFSNRTHMHKDGKCKMIPNDEVGEYLQNGWERGRIFNSSKGKIRIYKNDINLMIPGEMLQIYLDNGWNRGFSESIKKLHSKKGFIHIYRCNESKMIPESDIKEYLQNGWSVGFIGNKTKGKIWVHDESNEKQINENEMNEYLQNGWKKGRLYNKYKSKKNNKILNIH